MTRDRGAFSKHDTIVVGTIKFEDGSREEIYGCGTIVFKCQNGKHHALTDVYFIPKLWSNIINFRQLDERGCQVLIDDGVLRIYDKDHQLLAMTECATNRLYMLDLHCPTKLVCLEAQGDDAAWLLHMRFGHLNFDALATLARHEMVRGLPRIEHASELYKKSRGGCCSPRQ
ncbi:unnamed protein product [Urochloa humidicola]